MFLSRLRVAWSVYERKHVSCWLILPFRAPRCTYKCFLLQCFSQQSFKISCLCALQDVWSYGIFGWWWCSICMCEFHHLCVCFFLWLSHTPNQPFTVVIVSKKYCNIVIIRLIMYWCYSFVYFEKLPPLFFFVNELCRALLKKISRNFSMLWVIDRNVQAPVISHWPCVILTSAFNSDDL